MTRRALWIAAAVVLVIVFLSMLWRDRGSIDRENATLELIRSERMARLGYAGRVPIAYDDPIKGLTGEAAEIARLVLRKMGVDRVEGVLTQSDALVPALYARRFELIANGTEITPERCRQVLFSRPTHATGEAFLVRAGNPHDLHSYRDVARHDHAAIGVVTASVQHRYAIDAGVAASRIRVLSSPAAGLASLSSGVIDAFASDTLAIQLLANRADPTVVAKIERAQPFTGPIVDGVEVKRYGAFAFRKSDAGFHREFNRYLREFIGSDEHLALVRPFGITRADLPGTVTAKEICRYGHPALSE